VRSLTELKQTFDRLRTASHASPGADANQRRARLDALRAMVLDNQEEIIAAISADFGGRSRSETELLELVPLINAIQHARKSLRRWMRDEPRHVAIAFQPAKAWVRYEPLGVIGIMSPWNYPLLLSLAPLSDALAAGNCAMLKPSELTPAFSNLLSRLVAQTFAPEDVCVVTGGVEVAQAFSSLPFDHLVFTGSTSVGRLVMRAAAENLTPVTLELGGKSPAIVCPGYDIKKAANSVAFGKFVNAGQTCIAPDYALVPADHVKAFAQAVIDVTRRSYPTIQENEDYSNVISVRHRHRLRAAIEEARAGGATILEHSEAVRSNGKIAPMVVLNAPTDCVLMTEEIFGPVLPVIGYQSLEEAVAFVNARDRPLALYCFASDHGDRDRVLAGAVSGGVTVNGTLLHIAQDGLPFGGIGQSGTGAYHGQDGFRRFSHARAVYQIGFVNIFEHLGPPWGKLARRVAQLLMRGLRRRKG
jgi:coniferyl-aldehyde dehydrogenase